jgi:hypothetical protein
MCRSRTPPPWSRSRPPHGAIEQARGRLDELVGTGLGTLCPDMVYVWALTQLARGCVVLRAARHAPRLYQALAPYAG